MLVPLLFLIGLTLADQDGTPVPTAVLRAPTDRAAEVLRRFWEENESADAPRSTTTLTPLDDEVEEFPDEPEGDDEEDPGEAMGSKGPSLASAMVAATGSPALLEAPPPCLSWAATPARAMGSSLSLLCRLRF